MIPFQIDSAGIQQAVDQAGQFAVSFLPGDYQLLAPAISSILTLITAAIIRAIEKASIKRQQRQEMRDLVQIYLAKDKEALDQKINEIQNRNL